jgi:hypothetical protein
VAIEIKELIEEAMEANVKVQYISRRAVGEAHKPTNMARRDSLGYDGTLIVKLSNQLGIQQVLCNNHYVRAGTSFQSH